MYINRFITHTKSSKSFQRSHNKKYTIYAFVFSPLRIRVCSEEVSCVAALTVRTRSLSSGTMSLGGEQGSGGSSSEDGACIEPRSINSNLEKSKKSAVCCASYSVKENKT